MISDFSFITSDFTLEFKMVYADQTQFSNQHHVLSILCLHACTKLSVYKFKTDVHKTILLSMLEERFSCILPFLPCILQDCCLLLFGTLKLNAPFSQTLYIFIRTLS